MLSGASLILAIPLWVTSPVGGIFLLWSLRITRNMQSISQLVESSMPTFTSRGASFHSWNIM